MTQTSPSPLAPGIVLIGPVATGKSTLARLLAHELRLSYVSLDEITDRYYEERGLSQAILAQLIQDQGFLAAYRKWWPSLAYVTERVLTEHPHSVVDLGAGHSHYEDPELFARIQRALAPYGHVILVLPSPDLDRSVSTLRERSVQQRGWDWNVDDYDFIDHWVKDHCNHDLATITVYTEGKTPEETCTEILARL